jgi:tetratricopeptide (TPR) repeat protein
MSTYSSDQVRKRFTESNDFNEIFDAFENALLQRIDDIELYRLLFWNKSLSPEELCLFGEKLAKEFPRISFDVYFWLASVFETTFAQKDNYELAFTYYRKATKVNPNEVAPYLKLCECFDPIVNLPPIDELILFLEEGVEIVSEPKQLLEWLIRLYEIKGEDEKVEMYKRRLSEK